MLPRHPRNSPVTATAPNPRPQRPDDQESHLGVAPNAHLETLPLTTRNRGSPTRRAGFDIAVWHRHLAGDPQAGSLCHTLRPVRGPAATGVDRYTARRSSMGDLALLVAWRFNPELQSCFPHSCRVCYRRRRALRKRLPSVRGTGLTPDASSSVSRCSASLKRAGVRAPFSFTAASSWTGSGRGRRIAHGA